MAIFSVILAFSFYTVTIASIASSSSLLSVDIDKDILHRYIQVVKRIRTLYLLLGISVVTLCAGIVLLAIYSS